MKMCVNQLAVLIVGKKESRLIIFIIYFFLLFAHYSVFAKEPTFPGVAIADSQYRSYWQKYAKYLIQNEAPAHVKTGGDLVKARYIMQKIGDKAAFYGLFPNIDNSTRSKAAGKWGWSYRDRGNCGDMTNVLEFAFKGAGIKHYLIIEASKTGMLFGTRSWNATDPNTNHGAPGIPYGKNKIAMFDLWEHGRETGSFKEAGKSRWNQIESHIWGEILETQGYGDFDLAMMPKAEREKKAVKSKLFFDKILYEQQKWFKQKQLLPTRAIQRKKSFNQALTLEIDLNELINKINQEINNQKIAIQVLREQAEQVKKNSKTLQKDIEKTNTKITKARDECKKLNQIKINQALKGRIKRSVDKLAKLKQKAETLTKFTCEKTAQIGQLKDKKNAEKQLKKVDAEQIKAESLLQTAKKTIQEITQEQTSQLHKKLEQIKLKYKTGQEALTAIQQSIDTLETQLDESRILVSKVPSLDELNTLINKAKITKTSIMQLMEPYKKLPRAKILTAKIDKIKIPSIKSIKKERLWLKQHSDAVTKTQGIIENARKKVVAWKKVLKSCEKLTPLTKLLNDIQQLEKSGQTHYKSIDESIKRLKNCLTDIKRNLALIKVPSFIQDSKIKVDDKHLIWIEKRGTWCTFESGKEQDFRALQKENIWHQKIAGSFDDLRQLKSVYEQKAQQAKPIRILGYGTLYYLKYGQELCFIEREPGDEKNLATPRKSNPLLPKNTTVKTVTTENKKFDDWFVTINVLDQVGQVIPDSKICTAYNQYCAKKIEDGLYLLGPIGRYSAAGQLKPSLNLKLNAEIQFRGKGVLRTPHYLSKVIQLKNTATETVTFQFPVTLNKPDKLPPAFILDSGKPKKNMGKNITPSFIKHSTTRITKKRVKIKDSATPVSRPFEIPKVPVNPEIPAKKPSPKTVPKPAVSTALSEDECRKRFCPMCGALLFGATIDEHCMQCLDRNIRQIAQCSGKP